MRNFLVPKPEPYICEHCGQEVLGGRYHNHCPHCLWSKHVDDVVPGDRASTCRALMRPVAATQKNGAWRIVHRCTECNKETVVDSSPQDNIDVIVVLSHFRA